MAWCGLVLAASAETRETKTLAEVEREAVPGALVVFDIDNTLIEPLGNLGSDQWYGYLTRRIENNAQVTPREAEDRAAAAWNRVQEGLEVRAVEAGTPALIERLHDRGIPTVGLTARDPAVAGATFRELNTVGIDLARRTVNTGTYVFVFNTPALFTNGVMFVGEHNAKGPALTNLLAHLNLRPTRIVYADDKAKHVASLERECAAAGLSYIGFRYGATDEKVRRFNQDTADIQLFVDGEIAASTNRQTQ